MFLISKICLVTNCGGVNRINNNVIKMKESNIYVLIEGKGRKKILNFLALELSVRKCRKSEKMELLLEDLYLTVVDN